MSGLYTAAFLESLRQGAVDVAPEWGLSHKTKISLLNVSENATFRADDPARESPVVLRVHRPGYHTRAEIGSELDWIDQIARDRVAPVARALSTRSGGRIAEFESEGARRQVVAFDFLPGVEPAANADLDGAFKALGAITAKLHRHARDWHRPETFTRKIWDMPATIGPNAFWGDWRAALGLEPEGRRVLERAVALLARRLSEFGQNKERFGLIHADLRLANLLIAAERISVIDFDDCGFGWFGADFAAAISFIETEAYIPALRDAWLEGYRQVAPFEVAAERMLPSFVMMRRLQLTAWVASHAETPTAQELGAPFTDGTVEIAEAYLADRFL